MTVFLEFLGVLFLVIIGITVFQSVSSKGEGNRDSRSADESPSKPSMFSDQTMSFAREFTKIQKIASVVSLINLVQINGTDEGQYEKGFIAKTITLFGLTETDLSSFFANRFAEDLTDEQAENALITILRTMNEEQKEWLIMTMDRLTSRPPHYFPSMDTMMHIAKVGVALGISKEKYKSLIGASFA